MAARVAIMAPWRGVAPAAKAVCLTGTTARSVGRNIRQGRMTARLATAICVAAAGISIRLATRMATSATARTTVATSRTAFVSIAAAVTAAVGRRPVVRAARTAVVDRRVITITTSIRDRQLLRQRIRITLCLVRWTSC